MSEEEVISTPAQYEIKTKDNKKLLSLATKYMLSMRLRRKEENGLDTGNKHHISLPLLPPHTGDLPVSKFFSCCQKSQRHNPGSNTGSTGNNVHHPSQVRRTEGQEAWRSPVAVATNSRSRPAATQPQRGSDPVCRHCW